MSAEVVNPGHLRHQIAWQEKQVSGQDSYGQDIYTWRTFLTCRAKIMATDGREIQTNDQRWAIAPYTITQHFYAGLKAKMRIVWFVDGENRYLDVLDVGDPTGMGRMIAAMAREFEDQQIA